MGEKKLNESEIEELESLINSLDPGKPSITVGWMSPIFRPSDRKQKKSLSLVDTHDSQTRAVSPKPPPIPEDHENRQIEVRNTALARQSNVEFATDRKIKLAERWLQQELLQERKQLVEQLQNMLKRERDDYLKKAAVEIKQKLRNNHSSSYSAEISDQLLQIAQNIFGDRLLVATPELAESTFASALKALKEQKNAKLNSALASAVHEVSPTSLNDSMHPMLAVMSKEFQFFSEFSNSNEDVNICFEELMEKNLRIKSRLLSELQLLS